MDFENPGVECPKWCRRSACIDADGATACLSAQACEHGRLQGRPWYEECADCAAEERAYRAAVAQEMRWR